MPGREIFRRTKGIFEAVFWDLKRGGGILGVFYTRKIRGKDRWGDG